MTKSLVWMTDLHLNFVTDEDRKARLASEVLATNADIVLVGGDIGESDNFVREIEQLSAMIRKPLYFVLGNHDYYRSSIEEVRERARTLSRGSSDLKWLPDCGVVELGERSALVGHGGWGDGRAGDFFASTVVLNDYLLIRELQQTHGFPDDEKILVPGLLEKLQALGDDAAAHLRESLEKVPATREQIFVLMHVPPFHAACWHEGQLSDDNWAPHFVCQAAGEVLVEFMQRHSGKQMTVLCGHTHSYGEAQILDNLRVVTGHARYGEPQMQQVLPFD